MGFVDTVKELFLTWIWIFR